jgi:peptide/nickel transport system permease protein
MPIFWLGLILMMIFSVSLPLLPWDFLPLSGRTSPTMEIERITGLYVFDTIWMRDWEGLRDVLWHLILPAITLSTIPMAIIARITRSSMLEVLRQDYVRTAKAKGLSQFYVHYKHALRNAMIPIITVIGLQLGIAMAGAILTETIFAWHGVGEWIIHAVNQRDFNAVQGGTIIIATVFVFINLIVDLLYIWINPKLRVN